MKLQNQRILITGGTGFIGSHLGQKLTKQNQVITVSRQQVKDSSPPHLQADYASLETLHLKNIDTLFHLAWSSTPASSNSSQFEHRQNINPTIKLINQAKKAGVKRFIFTSSAGAVYGRIPTPFKETQTPKPISQYGNAKLEVENYLKTVASPNFQVIIFRPTNVIGKNQHYRMNQGIIPAIINAKKDNLSLKLFGNAIKDYLAIEDLVSALSTHPNSDQSQIYNLGSGQLFSTQQIVDLANRSFSTPIQTQTYPAASYDITKLQVDSSQANQDLNWYPKTDISIYITSIFSQHA